jgi:sterol desaturase/sphingolipid hydroxylase (fatty acid hydroxylase superfamily)
MTTTDRATRPRAAKETTLADEFRVFRSQPQPRLEAAAVVVALTARLVVGSWAVTDLVVVAAMVGIQPFFEWVFHVYVLHYRPITVLGRTIDFELARKHREHHVDPTVVELVFVPLGSLLRLMVVTPVLLLIVMPSTGAALTAMATAAALLLGYEWTHYLVHSTYRPKTRLFRAIWRAHRLHHYKNEQYWFGVTNPAADVVLRTYPDPGSVPTSPTARDLAGR